MKLLTQEVFYFGIFGPSIPYNYMYNKHTLFFFDNLS